MREAPGARDALYLEHMFDAVVRARSHLGRRRRAAFMRNGMLQDAIMRNIEIVGEAAGRVSAEFAARHPSIPWRDIVGMRNRLIHGYVNVELGRVWEVVSHDLPMLEGQLAEMLGKPRRKRRAGRKLRA